MPVSEALSAPATAPRDFYVGTLRALELGGTYGAEVRTDRVVDVLLDAQRPPSSARRADAAAAAASIRDATTIAAIDAYSPQTILNRPPIHVYRVALTPFHSGPFAVARALKGMLDEGGRARELAAAYWNPSGVWYLRELLAPSFTVEEEVPAASERDTYVRQWVHFSADLKRAFALGAERPDDVRTRITS